MSSNPSLDAIMDQATEAAANLPAVAAPTGGALAQTTSSAPALRPSLDDMADNSGMVVDAYLAVKDAGLRIDKNEYFPKAKVTLDMTEVVPIFSVRANTGGNTTFIKSYDGVSTSQGQNFEHATAQLRAQHQKVDGPYQTAEIPVTLLQDVPGAKKGQRLGITPPITGVKFWTKFYQELRAKGLQKSVVTVEISCVPQSNKNGNDWGVVGFELVEGK